MCCGLPPCGFACTTPREERLPPQSSRLNAKMTANLQPHQPCHSHRMQKTHQLLRGKPLKLRECVFRFTCRKVSLWASLLIQLNQLGTRQAVISLLFKESLDGGTKPVIDDCRFTVDSWMALPTGPNPKVDILVSAK